MDNISALELTDATETARTRAIIACVAGNFLELFDFMIYGYFAITIGHNFFPAANSITSLLGSFATFAVGFVMRPVGAMLIGAYGDRHGRKAALVLTITLMAIGTGATGLIPGFGRIGIWAPVLLVICRLLQGFSTGGEWGGAATFLVEHAKFGQRGLAGSWSTFSVHLGIFAASLAASVAAASLTKLQFDTWGWRIPFLLGFVIGPVGYYLRSKTAETPAFRRAVAKGELTRSPLRAALTTHRRPVLFAFGLSAVGAVNTYVFLIFMPSLAVQHWGFARTSALTSTTIASILVTILIPFAGMLSDRIGRRPMMLACAVGSLVAAYPLFVVLSVMRTFPVLLGAQCLAATLLALYSGAVPALLAELFPTNVRFTALSVGYGFSVTIFGGFAPMISTFLIQQTDSSISPAFYVMVAAVATGIAALAMEDRTNAPLE